jgi:hypothetical protein
MPRRPQGTRRQRTPTAPATARRKSGRGTLIQWAATVNEPGAPQTGSARRDDEDFGGADEDTDEDAGGGGRGEATDVRDPPREASRRPSTNLNEPQRASTNLVVHRNMFSCAMFDSEAPNMPMNSEQLCPAAA